MKRPNWISITMAAMLIAVMAGNSNAQKSSKSSSSGSSRPSGGSSKPSGSSRPSGGSSKPSGSSRPSGGLFGGNPKSNNTSTDKPTPKFGSPNNTPHNSTPNPSTPKFGSPSTTKSQVPPIGITPLTSSSNPGRSGSTKSQDQKREESRKYVETKKAVSPPKSVAVVNGQSVKVDTNSRSVNDIRSRPSTYITPQARQSRYETHIVHHHYNHPYSYYHSQPLSYGIGPYSGAFWWMMMEWSAERRAQWVYHHQHELSAQAYQDVVRDRDVQQRLAALESQKVVRNSSYIDPEFADNPTDVFDQNYVEAVYNPPMLESQNNPSFIRIIGIVFVIVLIIGGVYGLYFLLTKVKIGE